LPFEFRNLRNLGDRMEIPIPKDEDGFLGRECPQLDCEGYFKIKPGTGHKGSGLPCHCAYCGHADPHDRFWTKEPIEYARSVALRQITDAVRADLKSLEFDIKPKGPFGIGISMKLQPGRPIPLRHYREKALETHVTCDNCTLEYAVFGVFAFCPDCRQHNSLTILARNLALTHKQLALAGTLADPAFRQHIVEDALENCVSAFDGFAREACRVGTAKSSDPTRAESMSFQNLQRAANRRQTLFGVDLGTAAGAADWALAHLNFMRRHLIAHRSGVVDQQYLDETGEPSILLGRRVVVDAAEVAGLADAVERLGTTLVGLLPGP
jgi:hypothetical protein